MRIEELVLEGFKSYPVRTQITGWDPSFNAITGLNGSGKSNILDAICFVLGITNMAQMRAQNQQDLIYKRGQAGVTKASVTIVFDNSDRSKSPVGMEAYKQITVTRRIAMPNISKYLLNGHKSTQQSIQTLFQGVQLNINNPNFLIMQGRITKVLNMRPQEILGMVEEAAGTRMFEDRKDKAKKTMAKKDKKVQEITSQLDEVITPKLEKLRNDKRQYLEYQKQCTELDRVARTLRAWEWRDATARVERKEADIQAKEKKGADLQESQKLWTAELKRVEKEMAQVVKRRDDEMRKGGKLKKLEDAVGDLGKESVKFRTQLDIRKATIKDEDAKVAAAEGEVKELEDSFAEKQGEVETLKKTYTTVKDAHDAAAEKLESDDQLLQTLLTGLSSNAAGGGYMGQLAEAKTRKTQAAAQETQDGVKLGMAEKEHAAAKVKWSNVEREAGQGRKELERKQAEVEVLRKKVESSGWSQQMEVDGDKKMKDAKQELRTASERRDFLRSRSSQLDFHYEPPYPNFDHRKVKGLAVTLMTIDKENEPKVMALEVAAGGKLYNVVVEDERVGTELLTKGKLKKRVTLIPLNKISARTLNEQRLAAARRIAPGKVDAALQLIGYEEEVSKAMSFIFSDTLICADEQSAKAVTFSREVGVKSVTLAGDVYDPSGTLSGGAPPSSSGILVKVQEVLAAERKVEEARKLVVLLEAEEQRTRTKRDEWRRLSRELEIKEHEMRLLQEQVEGSNASKVKEQLDQLVKTIESLKEAVQAAQDKQKEADAEIKKLERDMAEFKNNKEGKTDELRASIAKQKKDLQKQAVGVKTKHKDLQTAQLEAEQMEKDIETAKANVEEAREAGAKLREGLAELNAQLEDTEARHADAERKLNEERAKLSRFDDELKDLEKTMKAKTEAIEKADEDAKQITHDIAALNKEKTQASNQVANLEKLHTWIPDEKHEFGTPGGWYDFDKYNMEDLQNKARSLEESQKGMKKKLNQTVLNTIEAVEKKENDLKKMMATVLKDKQKIEDTIDELDRYKRDALQKTWEKVNGDFGSIFAELLPGNFAKLQPPEGQDLMDGLEVKVQLGSVWKQSLTELSGGQRSLIALSLIMALLQFKPAPMYILDEIDAALDLSHTQHIGQLFRTRFKGSQFIVVSLKEGLFTNANVLFRARFRDGTSIVERTAQRSTSTLYS